MDGVVVAQHLGAGRYLEAVEHRVPVPARCGMVRGAMVRYRMDSAMQAKV